MSTDPLIDRQRYRLFGRVMDAPASLTLRVPVVDAPADVRLTVTTDEPTADWSSAEQRSATPVPAGRLEPSFRFFSLQDRDVIRIVGSLDVHLLDDEIVVKVINPDHRFLINIVLSGMAFAFWLERRGVVTLHGSAAVVNGSGVGFLARSGAGKSSIASFLTANGDPLITEDLMAVEPINACVHVHPGVAQLRLWPDQAASFVRDWESLERPHPRFPKRLVPVGVDGVGRLADDAVPLKRLYLLDRRDEPELDVTIHEVPGTTALAAVLMHSYLPELSQAFGWQRTRLDALIDLLSDVPIRALRFPTGLAHLPRVREAVALDLRGD